MRGVGRAGGGAPVGGTAGRPGGGRTGPGFSVPVASGGGGVVAAAAATPLGLGLLAVQEGGEAARRDDAARRRAESLLEELAGLQREMLDGSIDHARLRRLAALAPGDAGADPALRAVVQGVILRAHVELARRGWNLFASD